MEGTNGIDPVCGFLFYPTYIFSFSLAYLLLSLQHATDSALANMRGLTLCRLTLPATLRVLPIPEVVLIAMCTMLR
jgi:hypothetical protein